MSDRCLFFPLLACLACACSSSDRQNDAGMTALKAATDVFWALNDRGFVISKEKPVPSAHGCKPSEFLAAREGTTFRISVFECESPEKTRSIVEHPHSRHVDSLLRNKQEGGILQRGPLEIIVRFLSGDKKQVSHLMELLEKL